MSCTSTTCPNKVLASRTSRPEWTFIARNCPIQACEHILLDSGSKFIRGTRLVSSSSSVLLTATSGQVEYSTQDHYPTTIDFLTSKKNLSTSSTCYRNDQLSGHWKSPAASHFTTAGSSFHRRFSIITCPISSVIRTIHIVLGYHLSTGIQA